MDAETREALEKLGGRLDGGFSRLHERINPLAQDVAKIEDRFLRGEVVTQGALGAHASACIGEHMKFHLTEKDVVVKAVDDKVKDHTRKLWTRIVVVGVIASGAWAVTAVLASWLWMHVTTAEIHAQHAPEVPAAVQAPQKPGGGS